MADTKISALSAATSVADADVLPVVQSGATKKVAISAVAAAVRDYTAGPGIFYRVKGAGLSAEATNFNFGVQHFAGVNDPNDERGNNVVSIGWNIRANGAREDVGEAAFRIGFEEHYVQGGYTAFEYHIECIDTAGTAHRIYSVFAPKDGGAGSVVSYAADIHNFLDYAGTQRIKFDLANNKLNFIGDPLAFEFSANNAVFSKQRNAANTAYLNLPYFGSDDRLLCHAPVMFSGATPTTGAYANAFAYFNASSLPANGAVAYFVGPTVTGDYRLIRAEGSATGRAIMRLHNANASGTSRVEIDTSGTGDAYVALMLGGSVVWSAGLDNSNGDAYCIANGTTPGSGDRLRVSTDGDVSIPTVGTGLRVAEGLNAKQGVVTLVAGEAVVSNTAVTANSRIFLTSQDDGGTPGFLRVSTRTAGTSFTITSSSATDTSTVAYQIFEPA